MQQDLVRSPSLRAFVLALLASTAVYPTRVVAQEFGATAKIESPVAATNAEDATAAGTEVETRGRGRALEALSEVLTEVPGAHVKRTGAAGSDATVALRGAEPGHTTVLLGSFPLTTPDARAFDIGALPLSAFERVEVYRGTAPAWLTAGAMGGVVRLVPATAPEDMLQASLGYGSFGRREVRASAAVRRHDGLEPNWLGHARVLQADNDYPFRDDGQTRFDTGDDRTLRQDNADVLQHDLLLNGSATVLGGRISTLLLTQGSLSGVPGPLAAPSHRVRRRLIRLLSGVAYDHERYDRGLQRSHRLQAVVSASHQLDSLTDRFGELGRSRSVDTDDVWQRMHARVAGSRRIFPWLEATAVTSVAIDRYAPDDGASFAAPPRPSSRTSRVLVLEPRLFGDLGGWRAEARPSVRLEWIDASVHTRGGLDSVDARQADLLSTYRLAGLLSPAPWIAFATSAGTGARAPSIAELFGDRAFQEPNLELAPERSLSVDAGAVVRGRIGVTRGTLEARGFALFIEDLIRYERTAQYTVRPGNLASGEVWGMEGGLVVRHGPHASLHGSITAMRTQNQFGKDLPLRTPLQLLVRPEVEFHPGWTHRVAGFLELHHTSFVYLDDSNLTHLPSRTLIGGGVSLAALDSHVTIEARVLNLLDAQVTDVLSRPLPGRELRISLTVRD